MVWMEKEGAIEFVPDVFVEFYKDQGYKIKGECDVVEATKEERSDKHKCPHCGKEYAKLANLEKHIATAH